MDELSFGFLVEIMVENYLLAPIFHLRAILDCGEEGDGLAVLLAGYLGHEFSVSYIF